MSTDGIALRQDGFHCGDCGSPGVSIPHALSDASVVSCANCGLSLGSWAEYRHRVDQALMAEQVRKARRVIVADPVGSVLAGA
jgi:transcription elongation factor Elf1